MMPIRLWGSNGVEDEEVKDMRAELLAAGVA
jgi:hypothetical protein